MAFDLLTAYTRTGLVASPTNDAQLTGTINVALAIVENYLDRKFLFDSQEDTFHHSSSATLHLIRYPVEKVSSATGVSGNYQVHHKNGTIELHGQSPILLQ